MLAEQNHEKFCERASDYFTMILILLCLSFLHHHGHANGEHLTVLKTSSVYCKNRSKFSLKNGGV